MTEAAPDAAAGKAMTHALRAHTKAISNLSIPGAILPCGELIFESSQHMIKIVSLLSTKTDQIKNFVLDIGLMNLYFTHSKPLRTKSCRKSTYFSGSVS